MSGFSHPRKSSTPTKSKKKTRNKMGAVKTLLETIGEEELLARIQSGESMSEISKSINCSVGSLHAFLNADFERSARTKKAMAESAESWLDRGLKTLESALDKNGKIDASAARAYAQECARRAAIRNPKYRDKVAVGGDDEAPPIAMQITRRILDPDPSCGI